MKGIKAALQHKELSFTTKTYSCGTSLELMSVITASVFFNYL